MYQQIRGRDSHCGIQIGQKNTILVEDIDILLPVKFCRISFSVSREVKNVSANQRQGLPSCFFVRPENTKLVENIESLLPVWFHQIHFCEVKNIKSNDGRRMGDEKHMNSIVHLNAK